MLNDSELNSSEKNTAILERTNQVKQLESEYKSLGSLKFSKPVEAQYQQFCSEHFLKESKPVMIASLFIYLAFYFVDTICLPAEFINPVVYSRFFIAFFIAIGLFALLRKTKKNTSPYQRFGRWFASLCFVAIALHIAISSIFILPEPFNLIYLFGEIMVMFAALAVLKSYTRLLLAVLTTIWLMIAVGVPIIVSQHMSLGHPSELNKAIMIYPYVYIIVSALMVFVLTYLAYGFEKYFRKDWLGNYINKLSLLNLDELNKKLHKSENAREGHIPPNDYLSKIINGVVERSPNNKNQLTVIALTIDYFDSYKAFYGEQAAQACIEKIADCVEAQCQRSDDLISRHNENQFIVSLPNTNDENAHYIAESIYIDIALLDIENITAPSDRLTVSEVIITADINSSDDSEALIARLNQTLIDMKKSPIKTTSRPLS